MRQIQLAVVGVGAALLCLHALFPPRVYKFQESRTTSRAFILSSEFYETDVVHYGKYEREVPDGGGFLNSTSNPARLDYDCFVTLSIAISAATIGLAALLGLVSGSRKQGPARSNAPPTPPTH
jgi:hypothetical protein